MASFTDLIKKFPSACTVAGRVLVTHAERNFDVGEYLGDDMVVLNKAGDELVASFGTKKSKKAAAEEVVNAAKEAKDAAASVE